MSHPTYDFLTPAARRYLPVKRALDVLLSGCGIVVLSPVLLGVALAVKLESPGPILFKQKRVGKNKKTFEIWKFRSMRTDTPKDLPTHLLNDPEHFITRTGRFIRKTSLDELPQLFNIFAGQMAVIGPRPALWNQDDLIAERDKYHANGIRPGLTGWAQVCSPYGANEEDARHKLEYDLFYVKNISILLDIHIIFKTVGVVLFPKGAR